MRKIESIYYSYKNKSSIYYLTATEEENLLETKNQFIKTLSDEQIKKFGELETQFNSFKEALIKEIINYTITYHE